MLEVIYICHFKLDLVLYIQVNLPFQCSSKDSSTVCSLVQ